MISKLRIRKAGRNNPAKVAWSPAAGLVVPAHFRCPISLDIMKDPVTLCTGTTYDRQSIETWLDSGNNTCPVTNQVLRSPEQIPNHAIRKMIQAWCVENRSHGIERIPTPKVPVSAAQVSDLLSEFSGAILRRNSTRSLELLRKMQRVCRESERDRRCIAACGAGNVLAGAFNDLSALSSDNPVSGLEEILQVLTSLFPLHAEARLDLASPSSVRSLVQLLQSSDLAVRKNAVSMIDELVSSNQELAVGLASAEGLAEGLVRVIKEPICLATTKSSLRAIFYLISSSTEETEMKFVELGLISLSLEMLVGSDKGVCEKALGVLDAICTGDKGRDKAAEHALTVPVLVKKIFRVSDLATEFAVSILWRLCKNYKGEEGEIFLECLQVGAFQKVLLLLQVGCGERTKEKATELLKMMNVYRARGECIESIDFKQLKRPF